ncbi:hypothetical protein C0995_015037 [Termitomyces sp. Mi166|nr:hypothetical protein C0995_015037 [Termitomyces sp. Mi166\
MDRTFASYEDEKVLPYNASKAAVIQMAKNMACELGTKDMLFFVMTERSVHLEWMKEAMKMAEEALAGGEVPVGCVFVRDGRIIVQARNRTNELRNATRHAELEAIDSILSDKVLTPVVSEYPLSTTTLPSPHPFFACSILDKPYIFTLHDSIVRSIFFHNRAGINTGYRTAANPEVAPHAKIFEKFSLVRRVEIASSGNRGLGLDMALALCEQGTRAVYCLDPPHTPSDAWQAGGLCEEYGDRREAQICLCGCARSKRDMD